MIGDGGRLVVAARRFPGSPKGVKHIRAKFMASLITEIDEQPARQMIGLGSKDPETAPRLTKAVRKSPFQL
jgi:hypothetical protein